MPVFSFSIGWDLGDIPTLLQMEPYFLFNLHIFLLEDYYLLLHAFDDILNNIILNILYRIRSIK